VDYATCTKVQAKLRQKKPGAEYGRAEETFGVAAGGKFAHTAGFEKIE